MLFNSYPFLFVFFPAAILLCIAAARVSERASIAAILVASLIFYASWDARFLLLLCGSIVINFAIGRVLSMAVAQGRGSAATAWLAVGVTFDLATLGVFKYAHFAVDNFNAALGLNVTLGQIILPLGISFFTFEQIGYLTDIRRGHRYNADFLRYSVFVSFFPRLVAGPILRYGEIGPQLASARMAPMAENLAVGLTQFFAGLAKKVILADGIAPFVAPVFDNAAAGGQPDLFLAWSGALAYACQIYFDFSGYSDMAIGAARCFGIKFPQNFDSPYKSASIVEFWRRWHMTLSRFLRDYLYISLGGNRRGAARRYANLMATMLLGGFWHGANWTFMAWGGLHGFYLIVNHMAVGLRARNKLLDKFLGSRAGRVFSVVLTFLAVLVAWVFFRAPTFGAAASLLAGMAGLHGALLPAGLAFALRPVQPVLDALHIGYQLESGAAFIGAWAWIIVLLAICFTLPNTQELLCAYQPTLENREPSRRLRLQWRSTPAWGVAFGAITFLAVISLTRVSEFLYWQF